MVFNPFGLTTDSGYVFFFISLPANHHNPFSSLAPSKTLICGWDNDFLLVAIINRIKYYIHLVYDTESRENHNT